MRMVMLNGVAGQAGSERPAGRKIVRVKIMGDQLGLGR
jgi:hypothetical protein